MKPPNNLIMSDPISWMSTTKTAPNGQAVPYLIQKLAQYGKLLTSDIRRQGNVVYYKVDRKFADKINKEVTLFMEGFMKGLQHSGRA